MSPVAVRKRGFTLLEVLVAVTVFSFLVTALYSSLDLGIRSWQAGAGENEELEESRIANRFLRKYLEAAVPVLVSESNEVRPFFRGVEQELRFISDMPAHLGYGGLYQIRLSLQDQGERSRLIVTRRLLHSELIGEAGPGIEDESILVDDIDSFSLSYFGKRPGEEQARWHSDWTGQSSMPSLIRIRITANGNGAWPDVLVHPPTGVTRSIPAGPWIANPDADGPI